jgi:hypothetical protein
MSHTPRRARRVSESRAEQRGIYCGLEPASLRRGRIANPARCLCRAPAFSVREAHLPKYIAVRPLHPSYVTRRLPRRPRPRLPPTPPPSHRPSAQRSAGPATQTHAGCRARTQRLRLQQRVFLFRSAPPLARLPVGAWLQSAPR